MISTNLSADIPERASANAAAADTDPAPPTLTVATYNIHGGVGLDRRYDPERVAAVICELGADIVALQEVDSRRHPGGPTSQLELLAKRTGLTPVAGATIQAEAGHFGNALLTSLPVRTVHQLDLSHGEREPRGALDVELGGPYGPLHVVATHLGLAHGERTRQAARLGRILAEREKGHQLVLGDFNDWLPGSPSLRPIPAALRPAPARRTFPTWLPLLSLDRIWGCPRTQIDTLAVHRSDASRRASDHLPLRAEVRLAQPGAEGLRVRRTAP